MERKTSKERKAILRITEKYRDNGFLKLPPQNRIKNLKAFLSSPPGDADVYLFAMALILYKQNKFKEAWVYWEKIKNPTREAQILGASLALHLGMIDKYQGLVKGLPETNAININLAGISFILKQNFEKAAKRFAEAVKKDTKETAYQINLYATILSTARISEESKKSLEKAIVELKKIEHPYAYYNLYLAFMDLNQKEAAKIYLDKLKKSKNAFLLEQIKQKDKHGKKQYSKKVKTKKK